MGWFINSSAHPDENENTEQRSYRLGREQRNQDNGKTGASVIDRKGRATDADEYFRGYVDHGDDHVGWM
jgi:hypothetical protein